ncbi:MAG: HEAT repeat domain-containing protein [Sandaracinaceae bacterium]|nr:HEAT repeat domain-containing protein [Sandaracinaceae bacterium]
MKRHQIATMLAALGVVVGVMIGCRAKPDDAAGQAEELADPVRRENAIANLNRLYTSALAAVDGDRSVETQPENSDGRRPLGPMGVANASVEALSTTYVNNSSDTANGQRILNLLLEMQDVRAMPAFIAALDWRTEVTENHAITAAQAVERMELNDAQQAQAITALSEALDRVQGNRGVDNRMRIHFIRALGSLNNHAATPILTKVATRIHEDQSFLINRMAGEEVGRLRDPAAVPDMIKALFLFSAERPDMRMNDVGAQSLTQIGRPALDPLLELLAGDNEQANRIAENYIAAIRRRDEDAANRMDPRGVVIGEACFSLGQLGFREAMDPMYAQVQPMLDMTAAALDEDMDANRETIGRALSCVTSLVQINREESDTPRLREALIGVYERMPEGFPPEAPGASRAQLLAAMQHTFDPGLLDFLHRVAADRDQLPDFRVVGLKSYAFLANRGDLPRIRAVIAAEPEGGVVRNAFEENNPALTTAEECNDSLSCYIGKLGDSDPMVVRKACYMIARYGHGNAEAITALIGILDHNNIPVRGDAFYALDGIATSGSPEAVAEIDRIREAEEGRSSWNQVREVAMAVRARLAARTGN